ncbi:hypothetical protein J2W47_005456 [Priestia megaterium]|nr:hypothetical protein [Priestia megaterium]
MYEFESSFVKGMYFGVPMALSLWILIIMLTKSLLF